jgi:UDP-N-acetylglucosamine--N-acetylmuramyl-(pentapeptide) pyrophosphoryl-undecaprenol N-acetylglucosamine transferase
MHVVLAAGGTAGHIYPAINTARAISELDPRARITILGTQRGLDRELVPPSGFNLHLIDSVPFPRKIEPRMFTFPLRMQRAFRETKKFFVSEQVTCVVGFGGYASAPAYLAARSLGICMIVHEANSTAGLANRLGARLTKNIAVNNSGALPRAKNLGMPLAENIIHLDRKDKHVEARAYFGLPNTGPVLLVFGGSQGAEAINSALMSALPELLGLGINVLHASGPRNVTHDRINPEGAGVYRAYPFIERMDLAYAAADLSISRAGAMTVAEIAAIGLPSIFVPLPIGNGEQARNAQSLIAQGASLMCENQSFTADWIRTTAIPLLQNPQALSHMSTKTLLTGSRDAAQELARWALTCDSD